MGGVTKVLDINSDPRPGNYFSKIIPTKTGSLVIELKGEINGVPVDVEIPIEDVETTAVLDFPAIIWFIIRTRSCSFEKCNVFTSKRCN